VTFPQSDLRALDTAEEIDIETQAPDGAVHRTTVWPILNRGQIFVRSLHGTEGRWYREAMANPAVAIYVDGRRILATAVPADDPDSIDRCSAGFRLKYGDDPSLDSMLVPEILAATLRLVPV
jgi:hypothetical protein